MNNKNILMDALQYEKNMSIDMTCALNEASNKNYYNEIFNMFTSINESAKELYTIGSNLGYYQINYESQKVLDETIVDFKNKLKNEDD